MTQFDLRARLDDVAATVHPGPARPVAAIKAEARRERRHRRTRWGVPAAAAAAALVIAAPALVGGPTEDVSPSPAPADPVPTSAAEHGPCTRSAATGGQHTTLLLVEPDCSTTPVPVEGVASISYTSLSPDGSTIAFVDLDDLGEDQIELVDVETGERRVVASSSDSIGDPVWSPDGEQLAFWRAEGGRTNLFTVRVTPGLTTQVTDGGNDIFPAWSADGTSIAFSRGSQLWVVNPETGKERELSEAPAGIKQPFWGTNNGRVLYGIEEVRGVVDGNPTFRVVQLDPDTGALGGRSSVLKGIAVDAVYDDYGIHTAALVEPAGTTLVKTLGYDLSVFATETVAASITGLRARPTPQTPSGTTPDGRTYGGHRDGRDPDLIAVALGRDDVGYVPRLDIDDKVQPSSPEEALAWQERRNPGRFPAYADDGITIVGAFEVGDADDGPILLTSSTIPPEAEDSSVAGVLEIDEAGCTYLDDGATRHLLIWPWEAQLADASDAPDTIENWLEDRTVARAGNQLTLAVRRLEGQVVAGGPCASDSEPLYVAPV